jgi:hypothetical protein
MKIGAGVTVSGLFTDSSILEFSFNILPPHPLPLPVGERGRVRGNFVIFLAKYYSGALEFSLT